MALACMTQASVGSGVSGPLGSLALSQVECCVEGFPGGAFADCEGGDLQESLPAPLGVFWVYFRGIGLGRHEDFVCPVQDPSLGVCFEDMGGGLLGVVSRVSHDAMASSILEGAEVWGGPAA